MKQSSGLRLLDVTQQLDAVTESLHDERPSVPTGFAGLDSLLRRGGLISGTFVLLGGRTGTRKSTVVANMMVSMAQANVPVGLVGLDEQPWQYVVSLMSAMYGRSRDWVEQHWDDNEGMSFRRAWKEHKSLVTFYHGRKPTVDQIAMQMDMAASGNTQRPAVVFIDYLNKLTRDKDYGYQETTRIPRLVEDLVEWAHTSGTTVVCLHQLSRNDEFGGANARNAGHLPVTLAQLKYGGEEDSDIALGTYRPAMDPLGNMAMDVAKMVLGDRFDDQDYWAAVNRVKKYQDSTFLQLLKNRPGTHREERGVELMSSWGDSLKMAEKEGHEQVPMADTTEEEATADANEVR
jgi:RecA/RadA recombinase